MLPSGRAGDVLRRLGQERLLRHRRTARGGHVRVPGRMTATGEIQLNDPQTLYRRWEDSQWSPFAIDLEADRAQWLEMSGEDKGLIHFALSSLMVAEERITTKF